MFSLATITQWLFQYRYAVFFPIVVVEGPIVTILAGFFVSLGYMNFLAVYALAVTGDLTGDCLYYLAGRWGREKFIDKYGRFFGINREQIRRVERHFDVHAGKTLAVGKLLHGVGAAFLFAAGVIRMPFSKYFWYNALATIPKSFILMLIGYYFGKFLTQINEYLTLAAFASVGIVGITALVCVLYFRNDADIS
jgi:membrane-associated protein